MCKQHLSENQCTHSKAGGKSKDNLLEVVSCLNVDPQLPVLLSKFVDDLHSKVICKRKEQNFNKNL